MSFEADPYMTVTLGGNELSTEAWFCLNPQELLGFAPQRKENVALAGTDGLLPRPTYDDELSVDLQFAVTGNHIPEGDTYSNAAERLAAVKRLFAAAYFRASRDADGCVTCTVVDIDGSEYEGPVQVGPPKFGEGLYECNAVMTVTIPRGELEPTGS